MATTDTLYTARFELPDLIERGRDNVLRLRVYREGVLVSPTSTTVSVYDQANTAIVAAAAATVTGGESRYTLTSATVTTTRALSESWRIEWAATINSVVYTFRNEAALVRNQPAPSVTEADLYRRCSSLNPQGASPITSLPQYAQYLDEAWVSLSQRLLQAGKRPWLVISPHAMREPHMLLTLALIFEDLSTRLNAAYAEQARMYREQYEQAWARMRFVYDAADSGTIDATKRKSGPASVWLSSRGDKWGF